jgi:hypothetical protein
MMMAAGQRDHSAQLCESSGNEQGTGAERLQSGGHRNRSQDRRERHEELGVEVGSYAAGRASGQQARASDDEASGDE